MSFRLNSRGRAGSQSRRSGVMPACRILVLTLGLIGVTAPCGMAQTAESVSLVLHWQHQAQFAGYYMALAKGFYTQQNLDVQVLRGGPDVRVGTMLTSGKADFASFMLCSALEDRARGLPLAYLAQVVNRGNFLLAAWRQPAAGGPIRELADLNGRPVTIWLEDFRAPYLALFAAQDIHPVILPQYYTLSLFLHRGAAACSVMRYNEYHNLLQSGVQESEMRVFSLHDLGIRMPEDGIYCLEETKSRRPETCRKFVQASLEGWRYAQGHEQETLDVVMDYVKNEKLPVNRMHMAWMLRTILASIFPGKDGDWEFGQLSRADYEETRDVLMRYGGLKAAPSFADFVTGGMVHDQHP